MKWLDDYLNSQDIKQVKEAVPKFENFVEVWYKMGAVFLATGDITRAQAMEVLEPLVAGIDESVQTIKNRMNN